MLNLLFRHLDGNETHARLLFIDFSSAFNTIQPHILTRRLLEQFELSNNLVGWILDFLTNRTKRVRVNGFLSDRKSSSTGSPQGCVLSPLLFVLYTYMCQSSYDNRTIIKYEDDLVIVSLLQEDEISHGPVVNDFVHWCEKSYLRLNISKNKDMLIDFRRKICMNKATLIKGQTIEYVQSYKYLGTIVDDKLNVEANCAAMCKKGYQNLYCLRKLSHFVRPNVNYHVLSCFYLISFVFFFGQTSLQARNSLNQIVIWSSRLVDKSQLYTTSLYTRQ